MSMVIGRGCMGGHAKLAISPEVNNKQTNNTPYRKYGRGGVIVAICVCSVRWVKFAVNQYGIFCTVQPYLAATTTLGNEVM